MHGDAVRHRIKAILWSRPSRGPKKKKKKKKKKKEGPEWVGEYPGPEYYYFFYLRLVASSAGRFSFLTGSVDEARRRQNWLTALSILLPDARTTRCDTTRRDASLHVRHNMRHVTPSNKE